MLPLLLPRRSQNGPTCIRGHTNDVHQPPGARRPGASYHQSISVRSPSLICVLGAALTIRAGFITKIGDGDEGDQERKVAGGPTLRLPITLDIMTKIMETLNHNPYDRDNIILWAA